VTELLTHRFTPNLNTNI